MTDNHDPYEPIACGQHSRYELAVMHRVELQLAWRDEDGGAHIGKVIPTDIKTIDGEEFLIAQSSDGTLHEIRLDKIEHSDVDEVVR